MCVRERERERERGRERGRESEGGREGGEDLDQTAFKNELIEGCTFHRGPPSAFGGDCSTGTIKLTRHRICIYLRHVWIDSFKS